MCQVFAPILGAKCAVASVPRLSWTERAFCAGDLGFCPVDSAGGSGDLLTSRFMKTRFAGLLCAIFVGTMGMIPSSVTAAGPGVTCDGRVATITGNGLLVGTDGPDVIVGGNGNDTVLGNLGDDVICAGGGDDTVIGGDGDDTVYAGNGTDNVFGGNGKDNLKGENGIDKLTGNKGDDTIDGANGDDKMAPRPTRRHSVHRVTPT
jgi:Ca2+-binding RTX toxin-like protein